MADGLQPVHILGVDLGGTKTALIAGDASGCVHARVQFSTEPMKGYPRWLARAAEEFARLRLDAPGWQPELAGISAGGPADWEAGALMEPPNLRGWGQARLRDDIARLTAVPTRMEHDGRAGALAERRFGAGQGVSSLVFLTFGTGIGAGVILDGRLIRGAHGTAGECGHIRIAPEGPAAYGKTGSLEAFASGTGISRLAAWMAPERWPEPPSTRQVVEMAAKGDSEARSVLEASARKLGEGMAVMADLYDPELFILGSLSLRLPDWYLTCARETLEAEALPASPPRRVVRCGLAGRLQDVAALVAAEEGLGPSLP